MGNLLVRDVPDDLVTQLKARAHANGRSVAAEHRAILRRALSEDDGARFEELAAQLRALTADRQQIPPEYLHARCGTSDDPRLCDQRDRRDRV